MAVELKSLVLERLVNAKITLTQRGLGINKVTILINKPIGYVSGQAENDYKPAIKLVKPDNQFLR